MAYIAVLDADVLHSQISVDVLPRLAERRLIRPRGARRSSARFGESMVRLDIDAARLDRRIQDMRDAFREAMTDYHAPVADKARAEIARLGPRVERGELTATERRVAVLAANGLTNLEIRTHLSISRRTVESNLASTYSKLAIRSRAQLPMALAGLAR